MPAVTPPYDHALASALARAGADVELLTGRPAVGRAAAGGDGYRAVQLFAGGATAPAGRALKLARLPLDMARLGRRARRADVLHLQWLGLEELTYPFHDQTIMVTRQARANRESVRAESATYVSAGMNCHPCVRNGPRDTLARPARLEPATLGLPRVGVISVGDGELS